MLDETNLDCDAKRPEASVAAAASDGTAWKAPSEVEDADGWLCADNLELAPALAPALAHAALAVAVPSTVPLVETLAPLAAVEAKDPQAEVFTVLRPCVLLQLLQARNGKTSLASRLGHHHPSCRKSHELQWLQREQ